MLASAKQIAEGSVGLVFFSNVFPALAVKLSAPYWFPKTTYKARTCMCIAFLFAGFQLAAWSSDYRVQLLGVCFCSLQSGLGEASFLALTATYPHHTALCLTCWSSGTGLAGVFGYAWAWTFLSALGLSFRASLLLAHALLAAFGAAYLSLPPPSAVGKDAGGAPSADKDLGEASGAAYLSLPPPSAVGKDAGGAPSAGKDLGEASSDDDDEESSTDLMGSGAKTACTSSSSETGGDDDGDPIPEGKWKFVTGTLYVYMIPLFVVYFSEYAMQSGTVSCCCSFLRLLLSLFFFSAFFFSENLHPVSFPKSDCVPPPPPRLCPDCLRFEMQSFRMMITFVSDVCFSSSLSLSHSHTTQHMHTHIFIRTSAPVGRHRIPRH